MTISSYKANLCLNTNANIFPGGKQLPRIYPRKINALVDNGIQLYIVQNEIKMMPNTQERSDWIMFYPIPEHHVAIKKINSQLFLPGNFREKI